MVTTYYQATGVPVPNRPALNGASEADVCIIGGGLAGLTTAYQLARSGKAVTLLERDCVASSASGRNGGFVSGGYACRVDAIEDHVGIADTRSLLDLAKEGAEQVRIFARALNMTDVNITPGGLSLRRYESGDALKRYADAMVQKYDYELAAWSREQVRAQLATTRYYQGLYNPHAFHIHPLNYARQLATAVEGRGGKIFEMSDALTCERTATGFNIATAQGSVRAQHVVFAGSSELGHKLCPRLARAVLPIATYVIATEPLGKRLDDLIRFPGCIGDTRRASDYYRRLHDGRLLWGGRITTRRSPPAALAQHMKRDMVAVYPELGDVRIDYCWTGIMGYAVHKMPLIGELEPGIWSATAFGGHGLNTTTMAGTLVAAAIASGDDRWKLFTPFKASWGGGAVGRAGTQCVYWAMQLRDRFDEIFRR